ncbi:MULTISPECIES: ABC transporter ATP-binding protein [unclassified Chelatococcus]|uniref:ABC transporter ATP-binding protein n=1 Tax=unclassified Chelatococcus TaxID=2638111 RepID=UPI001BCB2FFA|nr:MULTISPECIES: ABC transporter ATP-binding protein [unclassified Chelatococcus]MBS7743491.1 ABC transporter ATP-binding protein [Chelatococcus sp. HY11]MBX3547069.1 ABC transporter ATP-binding protein [Chelatococcus sp.]CAH1662472.1 ABC transporter ATP-binding protein [Hyphomicrobiales bacterium]CAH1687644.1 ABC transporter ATP-binding protein [Hyphomicrobiales bacterium]
MQTVLEAKILVKNFGENRIIRGLNIAIAKGERHAVIGPNGAGKSTLFNLLTGYLKPTSGEILLRGKNIAGLPPHLVNRAGLARSFQITAIFPALSVFENIRIAVMARHNARYGLFRRVAAAKAINDNAWELVERVRLMPIAEKLAGDITYSEQRALEIGMALGPDGDVILLDEPTAGMSRDEAAYMVELMRDVTTGKTLIVIEHDMSVVFSIADRISVLVYGEVVATDTPEAIRSNAKVQEAYLGEENHEPA